MPEYLTPGVYYDIADASTPAIVGVRTDVAGFVGIAARGPVDTAVPIESWRQFEAHFGGFRGYAFLAYAVRGFFENGGRRCWVVRVAAGGREGVARAAAVTLFAAPAAPGPGAPVGRPVWGIRASSLGSWGNALQVVVHEAPGAQTVTLPAGGATAASVVASTSGFTRGTLVRLMQPPPPAAPAGTPAPRPVLRVVSDVDPVSRRLVWLHERPERRLPYDAPLSGLDLDRPATVESVEYSIAVLEGGVPVVLYERLSLIPEHPRFGPALVPADPYAAPMAFEVRQDRTIPAAPSPIGIEELRDEFRAEERERLQRRHHDGWVEAIRARLTLEALHLPSGPPLILAGGADGLPLLRADDFIGAEWSPADSDELLRRKQRGILAIAAVDEVAIVAVPDIHIQPVHVPASAPPLPCVPAVCCASPDAVVPAMPRPAPVDPELPPVFSEADVYRVQAALVAACETRRDRIALLEPPASAAREGSLGLAAARSWRSRFDSNFAAFYHPWLRVVDPLRPARALTRDIPPCGHVAGQYAQTDLTVGVHKAPANAPLEWAQDVTALVPEAAHGVLNPLGVNVIRPLPGRGLRILGARTASSDPAWRYLNVRRLLMMIAKSVALATEWAVFEPNDELTRAKIRLSLTSFLSALWERGALAGTAAEEAFVVKCDEENNPPSERDRGRLVAEIGVAPSHPFEFVVVRVWRTGNELELAEFAPLRSSAGGG